jgi:hypothetical protein
MGLSKSLALSATVAVTMTPAAAGRAHIGIDATVPRSVPKRGPTTILRQPTPTKLPIKNGPETVNFRPVL